MIIQLKTYSFVNLIKVLSKSNQVVTLKEQITADQHHLLAQLSAQTKQMQQANFDKQAFLEHRDLILEIDKRYQTIMELIANVENTSNEAETMSALSQLNAQLDEWQPKRQQTDVKNLPWGMPNSEVRKPIVSDADPAILQNANYLSDNPQAYSAIHQWRNTEYRIGQMLLNHNSININFQKVNGLAGQTEAGNWTVLKALPAKVQPADLAETPEVQITQAIKAKAKELDNNPAKIYKWVHDNIEYIPTYGSIQGSDYTLQTKRGNAFDTASLLIALLRASDIPARYVYGTVDIPAKQAMDWVGGVNNIDAAQNLLGQGGVPNIAIMNGSTPQYLRMEHVWVEANVNAISRGVANNLAPNNSQNQWLPLDASYKSYTRTQGIDLATAVPFDTQSLIDKATEGATIDEQQGSVQNLNQGAVNQAIEDYQAQVKTYLEQNHPNATVGDVLGTTSINPYPSQMLSPILPYQVKTVVSDYQELPDSMRHYFIVNMYQDATERRNSYGLGDDPAVHLKIPTVQLQGKPLAMSFKPATKADENKILGMLPKPDDNGDIDPNKLPSYISRNVTMSAEITLGNEVLASGNRYPFGTEVITTLGFEPSKMGRNATFQTTAGLSEKVIRTGEYHAIGYDLQGLSQQQLENIKSKLETVKDKLEDYQTNKNQAVLDGITKHDLSGSILQAGVQSYFAINDVQDQIAQKQAGNIIQNRFMSYGTFHTYLHPTQRYGIIFGASLNSGMQMDIDRILTTAVDKNNDHDALVAYIRSQGPRESLNENLVPEMLFDNPDTPEKEVEGVSAVKALQIAASEGQKIFTITRENYNEVLPQLSLGSDIMSDIRNAINAGHEVTTHEHNINFKGWKGAGYIIIDPNNGAGAYLISGGANGGFAYALGLATAAMLVCAFVAFSNPGLIAMSASMTAPFILGLAGPILAFFAIMLALMAYIYRDDDFILGCFFGGLTTNLGIAIGSMGNGWSAIAAIISGGHGINSWSQCYGV